MQGVCACMQRHMGREAGVYHASPVGLYAARRLRDCSVACGCERLLVVAHVFAPVTSPAKRFCRGHKPRSQRWPAPRLSDNAHTIARAAQVGQVLRRTFSHVACANCRAQHLCRRRSNMNTGSSSSSAAYSSARCATRGRLHQSAKSSRCQLRLAKVPNASHCKQVRHKVLTSLRSRLMVSSFWPCFPSSATVLAASSRVRSAVCAAPSNRLEAVLYGG